MRIGEDARAVLALNGNGNSSECNENLSDGMNRGGPYYMMGALTNHTVLVRCPVHMDVHNLDRSAEEQKNGDDGNKQKTHARIL